MEAADESATAPWLLQRRSDRNQAACSLRSTESSLSWPARSSGPGKELRLKCRRKRANQSDRPRLSGQIAAWRDRRERGTDEPFPDNPARKYLETTQRLTLSDDVGTAYRRGSGGGTGWDGDHDIHWWTTHTFRPSPPAEASWLELLIEIDGKPKKARIAL